MSKLDIYYFSATHWDREWYQDFQGFRYRLVKMTDALLKLLESDNAYKTFHFDGQTIVLEDYLEIRPEKRELLKKMILDGKILIGPWYVMPDEFLVSGESLIRNLMRGHAISDSYGVEPWKFGYVCDCFGHIAQLPQIFSGFGIKYSTLGRGTNEDYPMFGNWYAPDGSSVLNFVLQPHGGYGAFKGDVYGPLKNRSVNNPEIVERIKNYIDGEIKRSNGVPTVILMDGLDHCPALPETTSYLNKIAELYPEAEVHHCDLSEAFKKIEKSGVELPSYEGELNKTSKTLHPYLHLITNTLSSYYPIKSENCKCENLLEKKLEPLAVMSMKHPIRIDRAYVSLAYKYLIQNHPHDSICGCSIDQVHTDMKYRFDQVKEIGSALCEDFLYGDPEFDWSENSKCGVLRFYNTLAYPVTRTVTVNIDFPRSWSDFYAEPFGYERINSFRIYSPNGEEIPYKVIEIKRGSSRRKHSDRSFSVDAHTVTMTVTVPALGRADYKVVSVNGAVRHLSRMTSGQSFVENEFVRVDINQNGTLKLTDKKSGRIYDSLCSFNDDGEIGDGWYHANPVNDFVVSSICSSADIEKVEDSPDRVIFKITKILNIPEEIVTDNITKYRSPRRVDMRIDMFVGLSKGAQYPDVTVKTVNVAEGHRLKLMLPTGIEENKYFASQAFCFLEREVGIDLTTQDYRETDQYEKATGGIIGKRTKDGYGLAFVSSCGIKECASYRGEEGMLALTLLRSFRTTTRTDGEIKCRLIGVPLEYKFALMPLSPETTYLDMLKVSDSLAVDLLCAYCATETEASSEEGVLSVSGDNIAVSVIKRPESEEDGAVIVRLFNVSDSEARGIISSRYTVLGAELTDLNEQRIEKLSHGKGELAVALRPWQIATYKLYLKI